MRLSLVILSVLAGWALLIALVVGLYLILKPLENIRAHLEKIAMGVRAIEKETAPLGAHADTLNASVGATVGAVGAVARRLDAVGRGPGTAGPAPRSRA